MKKIFFIFLLMLTNLGISQNNSIIPNNDRKIQMAVLFDASGSMNGLLNQAKARIWNIVNELTTLRFTGEIPSVEIALYTYGNDEHSSLKQFVKQLVPFSTDLDLISEKLFSITTNGGSEYCGAVIGSALSDLNWSPSPNDLKMIYIAGNEPFNQGSIDYKIICPSAFQRQIYVNTIHCGDYQTGVSHFWFDGAQLGGGDYFHIDSDKSIQVIPTPFDEKINALNEKLNKTYIGYGKQGSERKALQARQDQNAESLSVSNKTERSIAKANPNYENSSWDLLDAYEKGKIDFETTKEEDLPKEYGGLSTVEKIDLITFKLEDRRNIQKEMAKLAVERSTFIETEKNKNNTNQPDDFGTSVNKSIEKKAQKIGYTKVPKNSN